MFVSTLRILIPGEFYVQKLKRIEHAEKRPLGHPCVLWLLTALCYAAGLLTFGQVTNYLRGHWSPRRRNRRRAAATTNDLDLHLLTHPSYKLQDTA